MEAASDYSVEINASVLLKLNQMAQTAGSDVACGPIYGYDKQDSNVISVSKAINFPPSSGDDFFSLKQSNVAFQVDYLKTLRATKQAVKLLGWFVCSSDFLTTNIINALQQLQKVIKEEQRIDLPALLVVFDPKKSEEGLLSLKTVRLTDAFLATSAAEHRFVGKNLIENKLSYKNIVEELPTVVVNNNLGNLKIMDLQPASEGAALAPRANEAKHTVDNLMGALDHFNYGLGNLNHFQKNLGREITNIKKWQEKNPKGEWHKEFSLPQPVSKFDNLVTSASILGLCNELELSENIQTVRVKGLQSSL